MPAYFLILRSKDLAPNYRSISGKFFIFFISFYIGSLAASTFLMVLSLTGIEYHVEYIYSFGLIFFAFFLYLQFKKGKKIFFKDSNSSKLSWALFIILIILITVSSLVVVFFAFLFPIRFWDAVSCWSLKGKAFFIDSSIIPFYKNHSYQFSHLSYPLYLPLIQTWIYIWLGKVDETLVKVIFPLFYISALFILYNFFRQKFTRLAAALAVFVFSVVPIVVDYGYIEYTNLVYGVILLVGVYFFWQWLACSRGCCNINNKGFHYNYLILSTIFFVILASIRSEGILYLFLFLLINLFCFIWDLVREGIYISGPKVNKAISLENLGSKGAVNYRKTNNIKKFVFSVIIPILISIALLLPWFLLKHKLGLPLLSSEWLEVYKGQGLTGGTAAAFNAGGSLLAIVSEFLFSSFDSTRAFLGSAYGPIWIILLFFFIINIGRLFNGGKWVFFVFAIFGLLSVFISLGFVEDFIWSVDRYILHIFPLAYFWIISNMIYVYFRINK
ncbi:MAG: hypothetical protein H8E13_14075 [Actinobacteria bacterium]|nr:hypothetical protein [Actinomycetota bacterium]